MKWFPLLLLMMLPAFAATAQDAERAAVRKAMKRGTCEGVPDIVFGLESAERKYAEKCWAKAQTKLVAEVKRTGKSTLLHELPGGMPLGGDDENRFIYLTWLRDEVLLHDAALGASLLPDRAFIKPLESALEKYPLVNGQAVCTRMHILSALEECRKLQ